MPELKHNHCVHLAEVRDTHVHCTNHTKIIHGGLLPIDFCETHCPYRTKPDFFNQTNKLIIQKALSGEYTPKPRSCGGCGTVKRRNDAVQFVWPYWAGGASGDELRWSIRSVVNHFEGKSKITIVGDRPEWWQGHVIDVPRIQQTANWPFRDMLNKMWIIATHKEIDDDFVWMMDDVYLIKPVTLEELQTPRAYRWREDKRNSWQRRKSNTMRVLADEKKTQFDYATHLPHYAEKDKLKHLFDKHDLRNNTLLWEVLYGNTFREKPIHPHPFFSRTQKVLTLDDVRKVCRLGSIFNHTANAWCQGIRDYLSDLFPEQSPGETMPQSYVPQFVRKAARKIVRQVKRRPRKAKS